MIHIDLTDAFVDNGCGLIVPMETDVVWGNQTGGVCCDYPELEGIFIPLHFKLTTGLLDDMSWHKVLRKDFPSGRIADFLTEENLYTWLRPPAGWGDVPGDLYVGEAWVPVRITNHMPTFSMLESLVGQVAILTWTNSD